MSFTQITVLLTLMLGIVSPSIALAQDALPAEPVSIERTLSSTQLEEVQKWLKADAKYQKWYKAFGNQVRVKLRHRPEPPVWLSAECLGLIGGEGVLVKACTLLHEIGEGDALTRTRRTLGEERAQKEALNKTKWFERVHLGGGWPVINDYKSVKYGAVVETHVSIAGIGRFEINLPGLMFVSVPDMYGKRVLRQATHFGVSLKLNTFTLPGGKQKFLAHLNLSNAKVMEGFGGFADQRPLSLMGLSFTVKK